MNVDAVDAAPVDRPRESLRKDVYSLLASLLAGPPSERLLEQLSSATVLPGIPVPLKEDLERLQEAAGRIDAGSVGREYDDLFVGLGRGQVVPYASWYGEELLMSGPLARLRTDLATLRLSRRSGVNEPEDHAAALCEAMVLLIGETEGAAHRQKRLFGAHLAPWMPEFFQDLRRARSAVFYQCVARLGEHFMEMEKQVFHERADEED